MTRRLGVILSLTLDGKTLDSLGQIRQRETYYEPWGRGGQLSAALVFGKQSALIAIGDRVAYFDDERPELTITSLSRPGSVVVKPPVDSPAMNVTKADIAAARERYVKGETGKIKLSAVFDRMPKPTTFPKFGWSGAHPLPALRAMSNGEFWLLLFGGVRPNRPTWLVYDETGKLRRRVVSDTEMDVLDANSDAVLVRTWDEDDVESVSIRKLEPVGRRPARNVPPR